MIEVKEHIATEELLKIYFFKLYARKNEFAHLYFLEDALNDFKLLEDQEKAIRQKIVDNLTPVLVHQMLPFNQVYTGLLETKYGVHLKQIQRGMHMHMKYKPRYGNVGCISMFILLPVLFILNI